MTNTVDRKYHCIDRLMTGDKSKLLPATQKAIPSAVHPWAIMSLYAARLVV